MARMRQGNSCSHFLIIQNQPLIGIDNLKLMYMAIWLTHSAHLKWSITQVGLQRNLFYKDVSQSIKKLVMVNGNCIDVWGSNKE